MFSDDVLLLFLPSKLFPFEISDFLHFFTFLYKTVVGLLVDFLQVWNVLLTFRSCVVVYLVRSLWSEEVWVSAVVIVARDLFSVQGQTNEVFDIGGVHLGVWIVFEMLFGSFVKVIYFFVAFRDGVLVGKWINNSLSFSWLRSVGWSRGVTLISLVVITKMIDIHTFLSSLTDGASSSSLTCNWNSLRLAWSHTLTQSILVLWASIERSWTTTLPSLIL